MVVEDPDIAPSLQLCAGLDRGIEEWLPGRRSLLVSSTRGRDCGPLGDAGMMHLDGVESKSVLLTCLLPSRLRLRVPGRPAEQQGRSWMML
jgi:hypothetical protein